MARIPEVTVTILRTPRTLESLSGSADVVGREELDLRSQRTLDEALAELPGIDVVGSALYGQEVRLTSRGVTSGFGTQRTLLLLDGRPLTDEYLGTVDVTQYPLDAVERVELVRGPASAVYGSNALGGVVNVVPRRGTETPVTELSARGGTFGTGVASLSHGRSAGPVDLFITGSGSRTDGYLTNSRGQGVDWDTRSLFSNVGYRSRTVEARFYGATFSGSGTEEDFDRDLDRNLQDLVLTRDAGSAGEELTRLRLYRSALGQTLDWFERPASDFDQSSLGAVLTHGVRLHRRHLVTGGVEARREHARVGEVAGTVDEDVTTWAGFVQDEVEAGPLELILGARFDAQGETREFSYRAGANFSAAPGTTLRAAVGRAFRVPTISDRFLPPTSFFGLTFVGNPDLGPEVLVSGEVGITQRLGGRVEADVTGFATRARDFWDFLLDVDGLFRVRNIARVDIRGAEAGLRARLGRGWDAGASYTYTDATYESFEGNEGVEGNRLDDNVRHQGAAVMSYRTPAGHALHAAVRAVGPRFTDPENTREGRLPSHVVADAGITFRVLENVEATLEVRNLTDRRYRTRPEFPQPGRAMLGGLRLAL